MALTSVLEFGDNNIRRYSKQFLVADCRMVFSKPYNAFSTTGAARCEHIELVVVAPGRNDLSLFDWFSGNGTEDGRVVMSLTSQNKLGDKDEQVLYFENAQCFSLSEFYDITISRRRLLKLSIVADSIEIDGVKFNRI